MQRKNTGATCLLCLCPSSSCPCLALGVLSCVELSCAPQLASTLCCCSELAVTFFH